MNEQKVTLQLSVVNAVFQYLATRPYQEVFGLIQEIQKQVGPQVQEGENPPTPAAPA